MRTYLNCQPSFHLDSEMKTAVHFELGLMRFADISYLKLLLDIALGIPGDRLRLTSPSNPVSVFAVFISVSGGGGGGGQGS